jgi:hypothetical protein
MAQEIDLTLIQRVKEFLQITDDLSSIELLHLLKDHRKRIHPDKFTEEVAKKEAEDKFKTIGQLIEELDRLIQIEKVNRGAKELALYEPLYDNVSLQNELEAAKNKIEDLESKNTELQRDNDELQKSLEQKQSNEMEKEAQELKALYKPSPQRLASLGIVFLLSAALATMTKIEEVYSVIKKYSPIEEGYISPVVFGIFIFTLFIVLKQFIENKSIARRTGEVCSPLHCREFLQYLSEVNEQEENRPKMFTESDALAFIYGKKTWWKKTLSFLGFRMFHIETNDRLKNYFINTLLNKKLITIYHAKDLDRVFTIRDGKTYYYWNN